MHRHFTDVLMPVLGLLDAGKDATRALLERCIADVRVLIRVTFFVHVVVTAAGT